MNRSIAPSLTLLASLLFFHCGPPGGLTEATLADHADALTTAGTDNLFTITMKATSMPPVISKLSISAGLAGQTATVMNFAADDKNGNGSLDVGESVTIKEPGVNRFDATTVGTTIVVSFTEQQTGNLYTLLASLNWKPVN